MSGLGAVPEEETIIEIGALFPKTTLTAPATARDLSETRVFVST